MKKSKAVIATAMLFCAAANFTACVYGPPETDRVEHVYGPPPDYELEETVEETVEETEGSTSEDA